MTLFNKLLKPAIFAVLTGVFMLQGIQDAYAASSANAKVSFTFDDGYVNSLTEAAPVLSKYGLKATIYVPTGCINNTGNCRQNVDPQESYMSWTQVKKLQDTYGWEIGSHTKSHKALTTLSDSAKLKEITEPLDIFASKGITVKNFASPEGDYDYKTLSYLAKYYASHRGFWDQNVNRWPYNDYILNVKQVQAGVSVASVKAAIDQAQANKEWLILVFHGIKPNPSNDVQEYEYGTSQLDAIAGYVKAKQSAGLVQAVTVQQGLSVTETNILPNHSFASGLSSGWITDNHQAVTVDGNTNGSYPSPRESLKFTGNGTASHLYSPAVPVINGSTYAFKAYVNTLGKAGGEFGYYVDEYDASGNWISGKWLGAIWLSTVSYFTSYYTPTSAAVSTFKIQTYFSGSPRGIVYADNYQLYNITADQGTVTPTPTPTQTPAATPTLTPAGTLPTPVFSPTPTATPAATPTVTPTATPSATVTPTGIVPTPTVSPVVNLLNNSSFESVTDGWADYWITNSSKFAIDSNSQGNDGKNSVHLTANTDVTHLFSSNITVDPAVTYTWKQYIKALSASGEFGFYIDEYDASGNWVSGQWKGMIGNAFAGTKTFSYTPSSQEVRTIRLQYYATPGSVFDLYLDSVLFSK